MRALSQASFLPAGDENRQCEDAFVWREDGRFRMIVRDIGLFNHEVGLLMESTDGLAWSEPKIAYHYFVTYLAKKWNQSVIY